MLITFISYNVSNIFNYNQLFINAKLSWNLAKHVSIWHHCSKLLAANKIDVTGGRQLKKGKDEALISSHQIITTALCDSVLHFTAFKMFL